MAMSRVSVGMAVRAAREAAGMTLSSLSSSTGISISALSRSENGQRDLDFNEAVGISRVVGLELDQLIELAETFENAGAEEKSTAKSSLQKDLNSLRQLAIRAAIEARTTIPQS